jgi:hypothetical protein
MTGSLPRLCGQGGLRAALGDVPMMGAGDPARRTGGRLHALKRSERR